MTYPPTTAFDILTYDGDEVVAGYRAYRPDEPLPGENHHPGYRWGWVNACKDHTREPDGFEGLRGDFIRMVQRPN